MAMYTKYALIKELSDAAGIKRKETKILLDALFEIACREAKENGFSIPGLCRIDLITKKERRMRNPQTGQAILIAEHQAPRIRILKKAKNAISPPQRPLIIPLMEDGITPAPQIQQEENVSETPPSEIVYDDFSVAISFRCKDCGGEIEAPAAAVGLTSECPVCGKPVVIPKESEPGTIHGSKLPQPPPKPIGDPVDVAEKVFADAESTLQKNQTIRIDLSTLDINSTDTPKSTPRIVSFFCKNCHQELEAPTEMMGMQSECPDCGTSFEVPFFSEPGTLHGSDLDKTGGGKEKNISNRTIRIEMPDF